MFRRISAPICLAVIALAATMSHAASASAARMGSFVIHNNSGNEVNYTLKWSDGDVESFTIEAGRSNAHTVNLNSHNEGATATIVFDSALADGRISVESYELDAFVVNDAFDGKDYTFVTTAGGSTLDLYAG